MTKRLELYRCNICHNLVEVLVEGHGELVCCEQPMELLNPKGINEEMLGEKHVPVVSFNEDDGLEIRVGSQPHPMENEHYIMFIQAISQDRKNVHTKFLSPQDEPIARFNCGCKNISAREFCNIHGLWEGVNND